ncbi:MAG: hypothetical protein HY685_01020 [Chloroflexi bacterium]|nr:hypothetical protein [Chloroflexota bacterium]
MDALIFLPLLLLPLGGLLLVLAPLVRGLRERKKGEAEDTVFPWEKLAEQREALLQAVQDLDMERSLGNLTEPDHQRLRDRYLRRADLLLTEIQRRHQLLDEEIDRAVRNARETSPDGAEGAQREETRD